MEENRKLNRKDYFLLALDIFEDLLYEQPSFSDYLPNLIDWCKDEIKKIDSQREMQRIKRQITRADQDWAEIEDKILDFLKENKGTFFRPAEVCHALKNNYVTTEDQISYRLRKLYENGRIVRKQIPSARSASMIWGYCFPQEEC